MSIDIDIVVMSDGYRSQFDVGNYTSNANGMLVAAIHNPISWFNNMSCKDAVPFLEHAVQLMESDPEKYILLEPKNNWGSYKGFLAFINRLLELTKTHPTGVINTRV